MIKQKANKLDFKHKGYNDSLYSGNNKKTLYEISQFFSKSKRTFGRDINIKFLLSNYAQKLDLKNPTEDDTSKSFAKFDLAGLKAKIDEIDVGKLKTASVDLIKVSNAFNNELVKKFVYDKLVVKVNNIDTSGFVLKLNIAQINQT